MSYLQLPKRVFNSPCIEYVNFLDGSFVNLIKLKEPYKNCVSFAVYETTKSAFCSNGLFKTYESAKAKFNLMVKNGSFESGIRDSGKDSGLPFPNNVEPLNLDFLTAKK